MTNYELPDWATDPKALAALRREQARLREIDQANRADEKPEEPGEYIQTSTIWYDRFGRPYERIYWVKK